MELIRGNVKVELEDIGEGLCGDYNPSDEHDEPLLRFTVYSMLNGEWEQVENASYCTRLAVGASKPTQRKFMEKVMESVYERVLNGESVKKICEHLSWETE